MGNGNYSPKQFDLFFRAYVEAALWSAFETERPRKRLRDLPSNVYNVLHDDCRKFLDRAASLINELSEQAGGEMYKEAGHAFWFSRNYDGQHGPTFDSEGWPDKLQDIAESLGERALFELKNGKIVLE